MQENRHAVRSPNVLGQRVRGARLDVEREYALGSDGRGEGHRGLAGRRIGGGGRLTRKVWPSRCP
jgi:hypothetical protein